MAVHKLNQPTLRILDLQLHLATLSLEYYHLSSHNYVLLNE